MTLEHDFPSFRDYLATTQQQLSLSSMSRPGLADELLIKANSPFEWTPQHTAPQQYTKNGALLVHGLLDSPYSMRHIGQLLLEQGFLVRSVLLPGHGTTPHDLLSVTHKDWIKTVNYGVKSLQHEVENIYLIGFSAGATLSLMHAHSPKVKGIILLAPAIKLRSKAARYTKVLSKLRHFSHQLAWYEWLEEQDYAKYRSIPFHLAYQAYALSTYNKQLLKKFHLTCPLFVAISEDDETVCFNAAKTLFLGHQHPNSQMITYCKSAKYKIDDDRVIVRSSSYPEQNVIDYSHVCIPIAPQDPHYGVNGDYQPPLYLPKNLKNASSSKLNIQQGALSKTNLANYPLRRLTYNPDYPFLAQQIKEFILKTQSDSYKKA